VATAEALFCSSELLNVIYIKLYHFLPYSKAGSTRLADQTEASCKSRKEKPSVKCVYGRRNAGALPPDKKNFRVAHLGCFVNVYAILGKSSWQVTVGTYSRTIDLTKILVSLDRLP
jgi:hypothetical protein